MYIAPIGCVTPCINRVRTLYAQNNNTLSQYTSIYIRIRMDKSVRFLSLSFFATVVYFSFFFFLFFLYILFSCSPFVTNKQNVLLLQIPVSYENCARFLTHRFVRKIYWYERDDHMKSTFSIAYTANSLHFIYIEFYVWRVFKIEMI